MKKLIIFLIIALSCTNLSFFKIGAASFTLFHAVVLIMLFITTFMAFKNKRAIIKIPSLFVVACVYIFVLNLHYLQYIKTSSFIYSMVILSELLLIYNSVQRLEREDLLKIVKTIILIYFLNILVAFIFIQLGFYPKGLLGSIFKIYIFDGRIRPYGFSDEPSYASLILIFTLFLHFKCNNFSYKKEDIKWYILTILTIMLTGSSYGYMLLAILLLYFILKSGIFFVQFYKIVKSKIFSPRELFIGLGILITALIFAFKSVDVSQNKSIDRLISIYESLTSSNQPEAVGNIKNIAYVDGSASMRVLPTLYLVDNFKQERLRFILFGRGAGMSVFFFSKLYEGNTTILGFIPSFVYNYGIVGFILFMILFISFFPKKKTVLFILFTLFIFNADFNTQIFLYVLFTILASQQLDRKTQIIPATEHAKN